MSIPPTQHVGTITEDHSASQSPERLKGAIQVLNAHHAFGDDTELILATDDQSHRPIVQLIDRQTRQILHEIPTTTVFQLVNKFAR